MLNSPIFPIPAEPRLRVLSLGAGVQSTTLALMIAHGVFDCPTPDRAIFADTMREPQDVYEHLDWLRSGNVMSIPVDVVSAGDLGQELHDAAENKGNSWGRPPFFVPMPDGREGRLRRQCTADYKIDPIEKRVRELLGLRRRQWWPKEPVVEQWIGISADEIIRIKPSKQKAIACRWPLVELGMTRNDCYTWLEDRGYPVVRPEDETPERRQWPPKSACTFCPFHSTSHWRRMKLNDPTSWEEAVAIDEAIRHGMAGVKAEAVYVHRSLIPLAQIDFDKLADKGNLDLFGEECEGMCGV